MEKHFQEDLLSVIIPAYNAESYLAESLDAVLAQDCREKMEIIIIDDCSTDATAQIAKQYAKAHPQIHYCRLPRNVGAGAARNKGLEIAGGRYIAFADSDDLWKKDKLGKQLALMREKQALLCYTAIEMIDKEGRLYKKKRSIPIYASYSMLLKNTLIANSTVVIDRRLAGDFRMSARRLSHDYSTWLALLRGGSIAYGIDEALVSYRVHDRSLSSNKLKSAKYIWDIQREDEKLPAPSVLWNILCWSLHSVRKYFL